MENMTEKMAIVERFIDILANVLRQRLYPVGVVSSECDIQCQNVANPILVQQLIADCRPGGSKAVEVGTGSFIGRARKLVTLLVVSAKKVSQKSVRLGNAIVTHF